MKEYDDPMVERIVIWVPHRGDKGGIRSRIFARLLPDIKRVASILNCPILIEDSGHTPFSIGNTWNLCASKSGDWDKAIQWGSDLIIEDINSAIESVKKAGPAFPYVRMFDKCTTLTKEETTLFLTRNLVPKRIDRMPFAGPRTITREAFEAVRGYDSRFLGWGHEDRVFAHCVSTLCGPCITVPGRQIRPSHPRNKKEEYFKQKSMNWNMAMEYQNITDPTQLTQFIEKKRNE